jgi:short subunit fatty acids transporter
MFLYHPLLMTFNYINENLIVVTTNNVVHMWLDNMWHLVQFELQLYIIVGNVCVQMAC